MGLHFDVSPPKIGWRLLETALGAG